MQNLSLDTATETIKRICSHDQVHPAFLRVGGVPLLITMAHQMVLSLLALLVQNYKY
jgi:hypothetical protein